MQTGKTVCLIAALPLAYFSKYSYNCRLLINIIYFIYDYILSYMMNLLQRITINFTKTNTKLNIVTIYVLIYLYCTFVGSGKWQKVKHFVITMECISLTANIASLPLGFVFYEPIKYARFIWLLPVLSNFKLCIFGGFFCGDG